MRPNFTADAIVSRVKRLGKKVIKKSTSERCSLAAFKDRRKEGMKGRKGGRKGERKREEGRKEKRGERERGRKGKFHCFCNFRYLYAE